MGPESLSPSLYHVRAQWEDSCLQPRKDPHQTHYAGILISDLSLQDCEKEIFPGDKLSSERDFLIVA
jgi:hypothetical protein